jgi:outer membrane protein assembly factor BamB
MNPNEEECQMSNRKAKLQSFQEIRFYPSITTEGGATMNSNVRKRFRSLALVVAVILALVAPVAAWAQEILPGPSTSRPVYIGAPAEADPLPPVQVPQNPFLALNPWNNGHNDAWMSDVYNIAGPLGLNPTILTSTLEKVRRLSTSLSFICGCLTFDSRGRIVANCGSPNRTGESNPESSLVLIDPFTLEVLAYELLDITSNQEAAYGSAYMYLDNRDRAVVTVTGDHVMVFEQKGPPGHLRFKKVEDYDLSNWVAPNDNIQTVMPDFQGRLWFVVRHSGLVGVLDPDTGTVLGSLLLRKEEEPEQIANSFPFIQVDAGTSDAFVVTTTAMYRVRAGLDGVPQIKWRSDYKNFGGQKPGQLSPGSGTSPTLLDGGKYVAITDNADRMHIVVYRTAVDLGPNEERVVCEVPVFHPGAGATEDSLIGLGRSLIVANQYVYTDETTLNTAPTAPGITRVDIDANGKGCKVVWTNDEAAAPQVSPKMSTKTGLVYFFTKKYDETGLDVYYWTAVDFRTGEIVWEQQIGTGSQFDSYVPAPMIGPTGALYVGVNGGFISMVAHTHPSTRSASVGSMRSARLIGTMHAIRQMLIMNAA